MKPAPGAKKVGGRCYKVSFYLIDKKMQNQSGLSLYLLLENKSEVQISLYSVFY